MANIVNSDHTAQEQPGLGATELQIMLTLIICLIQEQPGLGLYYLHISLCRNM